MSWPRLDDDNVDIIAFLLTLNGCCCTVHSKNNLKVFSGSTGGAYGALLTADHNLTQLLLLKGCLAALFPLDPLDIPVMQEFLHHCDKRIPRSNHMARQLPVIWRGRGE